MYFLLLRECTSVCKASPNGSLVLCLAGSLPELEERVLCDGQLSEDLPMELSVDGGSRTSLPSPAAP